MVLIFKNVVRKKLAILLKYEPFRDVLQRLNLDFTNISLLEQFLVTVFVSQAMGKHEKME